jgi:membrane AbrB-like protein
MERLVITLLVGTAGGLLGYFLRIPAGTMLGAMVAVGIYNVIGSQAYMPAVFRVAAQIILGCMLGMSINRGTLGELKLLAAPALVVVVSVMLFCLGMGFILHKFFGLDLATAFFGCAPGGMSEMSILALTTGADGPKVALLQLIRMLSIVSFLPSILAFLISHFNRGS